MWFIGMSRDVCRPYHSRLARESRTGYAVRRLLVGQRGSPPAGDPDSTYGDRCANDSTTGTLTQTSGFSHEPVGNA